MPTPKATIRGLRLAGLVRPFKWAIQSSFKEIGKSVCLKQLTGGFQDHSWAMAHLISTIRVVSKRFPKITTRTMEVLAEDRAMTSFEFSDPHEAFSHQFNFN